MVSVLLHPYVSIGGCRFVVIQASSPRRKPQCNTKLNLASAYPQVLPLYFCFSLPLYRADTSQSAYT